MLPKLLGRGTVSGMSLPLPAEEPHSTSHSDSNQIVDIVDRPTLRASGPAEIVQLVPYLLGFHPSNSVVLIALRGRRIVVSVRNDLDAPIELLDPWYLSATKAGADRVVALVYSDAAGGAQLPEQHVVDALEAKFEKHRLKVVDIVLVGDGRWWSYRCPSPQCCPPEGTPIDTTGAIAASAVAEGLVALPTREALESELAIDEAGMRLVEEEIGVYILGEGVGRFADQRPDQRPDVRPDERVVRLGDWAAVRRFVREVRRGDGITPAMAARVLCALRDRSVRDATIGYLVARPEPEVCDAWRQLTRVAPVSWRPAPAVLYALWCYADGDGARSNVGVDVALDANPDYAMAQIVLELQASGLNPVEFIHEMAHEASLVGRRIQRKRHPASGRRR